MYAAQANSPNTELAGDLDTTSREITVVDASVLPAVPFLLTIGYDTATSETVLVTAAEENTLTVTRGIDGPAQIWVAGVKCARIFTAKDLNDIQTNIETIKTALEEAQEDLSDLESGKADQIIISGVEASSTAANSYLVGQYLILSGALYRVTAAIEAGDTINDSGAGANVAAATVGSELTGLRNTLNQVEDAIAYVQSGDTASRTYTEGQFVYLKNHATLAEGLYTVNSGGIPSGTTVTGHLTADTSGGLNALKSIISDLVVTSTFTFQNTGSVAAGGNKQFADVDISSAVPLGYKMIGCFPINTGDKMFNIFLLIPNYANKTVTINIANVGSSATSGTPQINVVSIRDI